MKNCRVKVSDRLEMSDKSDRSDRSDAGALHVGLGWVKMVGGGEMTQVFGSERLPVRWKCRVPRALLAAGFLLGNAAFAGPSRVGRDLVTESMLWSLVPGGGHLYLGEQGVGTAYLGSTFSLVGAGFWLDERNDELGRDDEINTFWLLALKDWELSFFTTYRSALRASRFELEQEGVDDAPVRELFLAPFRRENLSDPLVMLAATLGAIAAAFDARDAEQRYDGVERVEILGGDANQEWGMGAYAIDAFSLSIGAAVSEEAVWRGIVQNESEKAYGRRWGLWSTSALFGAAHIVDLHGEIRPERVVAPTVAGLYFGYMFQRDDHRLSAPIAAHFWYNFAAMMTGFALDPDDNPLGVSVSFSF